MLEKGFWFSSSGNEEALEQAQDTLDDFYIGYYPPITASVYEPADGRNFLRLIDVLFGREIVSEDTMYGIFSSLPSYSQLVLKNTYDRVGHTSYLTNEDMLVILSERACIPIRLSLAHTFIELRDPSQFERANNLFSTKNIAIQQPVPLPLRRRSPMESMNRSPIRYLGKDEVHDLSLGLQKEKIAVAG